MITRGHAHPTIFKPPSGSAILKSLKCAKPTTVPIPETESVKPSESMGLIAGSKSLPLIFAKAAKASGVQRLVAVGFRGETDPELEALVDDLVWLRVGEVGAMTRAFTQRDVKSCVMLGQIAPSNLFNLRPDLRAVKILWKLKERNAHSLFGAIIDELAAQGVAVIEPTPWLTSLLPGPGYLIGRALSDVQKQDVDFGLRIAREISRLEIGQCVVVKEGTVLAVEGFEGTDQCLARGGSLAGPKGGAVAVKIPKKEHDLRFDIPCVGMKTVETCADAGISVLAFDPHRTYLIEREGLESLAQQRRVKLVSLTDLPGDDSDLKAG